MKAHFYITIKCCNDQTTLHFPLSIVINAHEFSSKVNETLLFSFSTMDSRRRMHIFYLLFSLQISRGWFVVSFFFFFFPPGCVKISMYHNTIISLMTRGKCHLYVNSNYQKLIFKNGNHSILLVCFKWKLTLPLQTIKTKHHNLPQLLTLFSSYWNYPIHFSLLFSP